MDLATLIGLIGTFACIIASILIGGSPIMFVNIPSLVIVIGGTFAVTLMKFPLANTLGAFKVGIKAFLDRSESVQDLIQKSLELAQIARKDGVLGLEHVKIENKFLNTGMQMVIDGQQPDLIRRLLLNDLNTTITRHEQGQDIFRGMGDTAPAMGMIGTLIGLVQMMANMEDPKSIGPAMAVALLTTLYGAVIANAFALPIADKLSYRSKEEKLKKKLIMETVNAILEGSSPRILEDILKTFLPPSEVEKMEEQEALH